MCAVVTGTMVVGHVANGAGCPIYVRMAHDRSRYAILVSSSFKKLHGIVCLRKF